MTMRGLSLIEVLVALAVAMTAIAAIAASASAILSSRISSEMELAMTLAAERSLEEMLAADPAALAEGSTADLVPDPLGPFSRTRTVRRGPEENLRELEVVIEGSGGAAPVVFRTLRWVPWRAL